MGISSMGGIRGDYNRPDKAEGERAVRGARVEASREAAKRDKLAAEIHDVANAVDGGDDDMIGWAVQALGRIRADLELVRLTLNQARAEVGEDG